LRGARLSCLNAVCNLPPLAGGTPSIGNSQSMNKAPECRENDDPPGERLVIPEPMFARIVAHLCRSLPAEGCGLIGIANEPDAPLRAERFYPGTNDDQSPTHYTMNVGEVVAAFDDMDRRGLRLGAIVHSHPTTPPTPSPTDLREAFYPEALMLIVSFAADEPVARAWRIINAAADRAMTEVPIEREGGSPC
jgi:proteasome lid subunit RPN8/RPN11